jgi:Putative zinc-finger
MAMDHAYIQEHQVVDRYVMGRLTEAEADRFEDHYLTCDECLRNLNLAQQFQSGFRQVAAEEAVGLMAVLAAAFRSRRSLGLGLALALVLAAFTLLLVRSGRLGDDLEAARVRLAVAEDRRAAEARKATEAGRARDELRARLEQERARLEGVLAEAEGRREEAGPAPRSQVSAVWLVTLVPARSGPAADEPFQRLTLPPDLESVVLELDLDLAGPDPYRVTLRRRDGTAVWTAANLRPGPSGTLALGLDPSLLQPGDYRLLIEALPAEGSPFPAARFAFRVVK